MPIPQAPDSFGLVQGNWPPENEETFAASAASLAAKVTSHNVTASDYRSAISGLGEEVFRGLTADKAREEFTSHAGRHDEEEQHCQKLSETIGSLGMQILNCKNQINTTCISATNQLIQLNLKKNQISNDQQKQQIQAEIDRTTSNARQDIKQLHTQLEQSLSEAETSLQQLDDQMKASHSGIAQPENSAMVNYSTPAADAARSATSPVSGDTGGAVGGSGAAEAGSAANAPVNPASMMSGLPPAQAPQAPAAGGSPGGGMGSQLPGQELASKAMDMAQNANGKDSTFLSDSSVKDLLAASEHGGSGGEGGKGSDDGAKAGSHDNTNSGNAQSVSASNPTVAGSPSPAAPVTSARPLGGPTVAITELSGSEVIGGPVSGLTSAAADAGGLATGPATQVAAATNQGIPAGINGLSGTNSFGGSTGPGAAGTAAIPSTIGPGPSPQALSQQQVVPPTPQQVPAASPPPPPPVPAAPAPVTAPAPPVSAPPVTPGVAPLPASVGAAATGLLDLINKAAMLPTLVAAPAHLDRLPVEQRITLINTASIITQMRERGWVPSIATALVDDGTKVAVAIATADDLSVIPADITIPKAAVLLHGFHLGEEFRTQWAGNADTATKLVAAFDRHPALDRSMIKHLCAFTTKSEIRDPGVPFTPMSMDAAWAVRYLYTPPQETAPAYTLNAEALTATQIGYVMAVAAARWNLPTARLLREGQAFLESASMFASRWSLTGEATLIGPPRGYDNRIAGYLYAATNEALQSEDLHRASWYAQNLRYQTLPSAEPTAA